MQSLRLEQTPLKTEQRGVVNFCVRLGRSPSETQALLKEAYKQDALRKAATRTYYKRFQALGVGVYEEKRKSKMSKERHSASESSENDFENKESNSSHFTRNCDPLISQASVLINYSGKENGDCPGIQAHIKTNEDSTDIDDDLTDILEDDIQEDQGGVSKYETYPEDSNVSSSITNNTYNETLGHSLEDDLQEDQGSVSKYETYPEDINVSSTITNDTLNDTLGHSLEELSNINSLNNNMQQSERLSPSEKNCTDCENNSYNNDKNCKENSSCDQFNQTIVNNCRNNTEENTSYSNQCNSTNDNNKSATNILLCKKEQENSISDNNELHHNKKYKHLLEIRRTDDMNWFVNLNGERWKVIRKTDSMKWFVKLNGEHWKVKSYHVYI